ncbi:hypothetical protein HZH66_003124 [Vespula vulgaris]|uniref:Uncharacterized protein n=1 Tax=Vespula vulgaris TaxID=7454 RepID=A0A834NGM3_VESVU|nr:hypothetical protein HZH66_003124 [Vespula vulgaris]
MGTIKIENVGMNNDDTIQLKEEKRRMEDDEDEDNDNDNDDNDDNDDVGDGDDDNVTSYKIYGMSFVCIENMLTDVIA